MNKQKSFTLIELLVVIVIIGILAGVIIVSVNSSINKANFAKVQAFSSTVQNELLGDLVSEWTFDNASNPGEDTWGNNDGTVYGGAIYKTKADGVCVYGGCYEFDGGNDYIDLNYNYVFTNNNTLSFWAKINEQSYMGFVGGNLGLYSYLRFGKGNEREGIFGETNTNEDDIDLHFNNQINYNVWYYFVATEDTSNIWRLYIDGVLQTDTSTSINSNLTIKRIGQGRIATDYFNGLMDDIRIYNAALSSAQIKQQYIAGLNSLLAKGSISEEEYNQKINALAYEK